MEFYERASGGRLHANFIRPGGLSMDISEDLLYDIYNFFIKMHKRLNEMEDILSKNRIWLYRLLNIGK